MISSAHLSRASTGIRMRLGLVCLVDRERVVRHQLGERVRDPVEQVVQALLGEDVVEDVGELAVGLDERFRAWGFGVAGTGVQGSRRGHSRGEVTHGHSLLAFSLPKGSPGKGNLLFRLHQEVRRDRGRQGSPVRRRRGPGEEPREARQRVGVGRRRPATHRVPGARPRAPRGPWRGPGACARSVPELRSRGRRHVGRSARGTRYEKPDGLRLFRRRRAARCGRCRGRRLRGRSRRARPHSMRRLWFLAHAPERGGRCRPGGCGRLGRRWSRLLRSGRGRWCRGRRRRRVRAEWAPAGRGVSVEGEAGRGGEVQAVVVARRQCHSRDGHRRSAALAA